MKRREDDLKGGLVLELGMGVHGDAAAVVPHGERAVLAERDLDA